MNPNIEWNFQICISVPLSMYGLFSLYQVLKSQQQWLMVALIIAVVL